MVCAFPEWLDGHCMMQLQAAQLELLERGCDLVHAQGRRDSYGMLQAFVCCIHRR